MIEVLSCSNGVVTLDSNTCVELPCTEEPVVGRVVKWDPWPYRFHDWFIYIHYIWIHLADFVWYM